MQYRESNLYRKKTPSPLGAYVESILGCYKSSFVWEGRATRHEFWPLVILHLVLFTGVCLAMLFQPGSLSQTAAVEMEVYNEAKYGLFMLREVITQDASFAPLSMGIGPLIYVGFLVLSLPALIAVHVRRLHDLGRPAWLMLGCIIPVYYLMFLVVFCKKGDPLYNEWSVS